MNLFRARSHLVAFGASAVLGALVAMTSPAAAAPLVAGLGGPAGFGTTRMHLNDDGGSCDGTPGEVGMVNLDAAFPSSG